MAELGVTNIWMLTLRQRELMLVLKALGGRLTEAEIDEAAALGDKLTDLRIAHTKDALQAIDRIEQSIAQRRGEA